MARVTMLACPTTEQSATTRPRCSSRDLRRNPAPYRRRLQCIGWIRVGTTQGRGRYDRHTKRAQPKKDIWLRTLRKDWKRTLNR